MAAESVRTNSPLHLLEGYRSTLCCHFHEKEVPIERSRGCVEWMQDQCTPLMRASCTGHAKCVKVLIESGVDVNRARRDNSTALIMAAAYGHVECVKLLVNARADVNLWMKNGWTALMMALKHGNVETVKVLLDAGANPDYNLEGVGSALMVAVESGYLSCVKATLDAGFDVNSTNEETGWTALMVVSRKGDARCVRLLLDVGGDVNHKGINGLTALMIASDYGQVVVLQLLIDARGDVNETQVDGWTALMAASKNGQNGRTRSVKNQKNTVEKRTEEEYEVHFRSENIIDESCHKIAMDAQVDHLRCMEILIDSAANINQVNRRGWSALMIAAHYGEVESIKVLLRAGADVGLEQVDGWTALLLAAGKGHKECVQELVQAGADVKHCNSKGKTAVMIASYRGHAECIKELSNMGADVDYYTTNRLSAILLAARYGYEDCLQVLLDCGADIEHYNAFGWTAVIIAAQYGHVDFLRLLLAAGGDTTHEGGDGETALMKAAKYGHVECLKILLSNVNEWTNHCDEKNALLLAAKNGNMLCMGALLKHLGNAKERNTMVKEALFYAVKGGHSGCCLVLLQNGANAMQTVDDHMCHSYNGCYRCEHTALMIAAAYRNIDTVEVLLKTVEDIDHIGSKGRTTLMNATIIGDEHYLKLLLKSGADTNISDDFGRTALMYAAIHNEEKCMDLLLNHGARIDTVSNEQLTAFMYAELKEYGNCMFILDEAYNAVPPANERSPSLPPAPSIADLHNNSHLAETQQLMKDIEGDSTFGSHNYAAYQVCCIWVALVHAVLLGQVGRMTALLDLATHTFYGGEMKGLLLLLISWKGDANLLQYLLRRGMTEIATCSKFIGYSLLKLNDIEAHSKLIMDITQALKDCSSHGHDVCCCTSPIMAVVRGASPRSIGTPNDEVILSGDQNEEDSDRVKCFKMLLDSGADVNLADEHGLTALMLIQHTGHLGCTKSLVEIGADINKRDNCGNNALMCMAFGGHADCLRVLLEAGADINKVNASGCTAFMIAAENGHHHCIKILLEFGSTYDAALIRAAMSNHIETALVCVQAGMCSKCTEDGKNSSEVCNQESDSNESSYVPATATALISAAREGHGKFVEAVLEACACVRLGDEHSRIAFGHAVENSSYSVLRSLFKQNPEMIESTYNNIPLIHHFLQNSKHGLSFIEYMVRMGTSINVLDGEGHTILDRVLQFPDTYAKRHVVKVLLRHGADPNLTPNKALFHTLISRETTCALLLWFAGCRVDHTCFKWNSTGVPPIEWPDEEDDGSFKDEVVENKRRLIVVQLLDALCKEPRSLQHMCRYVIRMMIPPSPRMPTPAKIQVLLLSSVIKEYIGLPELKMSLDLRMCKAATLAQYNIHVDSL